MNNTYRTLADALRDRLAVIADREAYQRDPTAHLEDLKAVSGRIVALRAALPTPVPAELLHYLDRSSYDKALAFIEQM